MNGIPWPLGNPSQYPFHWCLGRRFGVRWISLENGDPTSGRGIPIIMISAWELLSVLVDDFACRLRFDVEERNDSMKEPTCSHASGAAAEQIPENKLFHADVRSSSQYSGSKRKESHDVRLVCVVPARLRSEGDGACAEEGGHEERPRVSLLT